MNITRRFACDPYTLNTGEIYAEIYAFQFLFACDPSTFECK